MGQKSWLLGWITVILMVFFLQGCSPTKLPDLRQIELVNIEVIGGPDSLSLMIRDSENIEKVLDVHKKLLNYKSKDYKTWMVDLKIQYVFINGETKEVIFKGIRPIDEFLGGLYNSMEAKKQMNPIFQVEKESIAKVEFSSWGKKYTFETSQRDIIDSAYENTIIHFESTDYFGAQEFFQHGDVVFYDANSNRIASGLILRGDDHWEELFSQYPALEQLKVFPDDIAEIKIVDDKSGREYFVTDLAVRQQILDTYQLGWTNDSVVAVQIKLVDDGRTHLYGSYKKGQVPQFLPQLLAN